jgi:Na+-transporting methylmalonyl-CoA/oxaloacetate decarboxylase gamma subunit
MRYLKRFLVITFLIFLCCEIGCVSDEANRYYLSEKLPPKKIKEVEVLREKPQRPFVVVADFQAIDASFKYMRKRAAQVGADAVIIVPVGGSYSEKEVWAGEDRYSDTYSRLTATAIKYTDQ